MIKIMFVCLGNICRSPMAEFVLKDMISKRKLESQFEIASSGTSSEEFGHPVHYGTKQILNKYGIDTSSKRANTLTFHDYENYDYFIGMEERNIIQMKRIFSLSTSPKIVRLMDFTATPQDIDDPWYTGDFDLTYKKIYQGCDHLLQYLLKSN